jgi:hypothetical protein
MALGVCVVERDAAPKKVEPAHPSGLREIIRKTEEMTFPLAS